MAMVLWSLWMARGYLGHTSCARRSARSPRRPRGDAPPSRRLLGRLHDLDAIFFFVILHG